jgi:hypothetical protein
MAASSDDDLIGGDLCAAAAPAPSAALSDEEDEEEMARARKRRRVERCQHVLDKGHPCVLAVILGSSRGRWCDVVHRSSNQLHCECIENMHRQIYPAGDARQPGAAVDAADDDNKYVVLGVVVMPAFEMTSVQEASGLDKLQPGGRMADMILQDPRHLGRLRCIISYPILKSAFATGCDEIQVPISEQHKHLDGIVFQTNILKVLRDSGIKFTVVPDGPPLAGNGGQPVGIDQLATLWSAKHQMMSAPTPLGVALVGWRVWRPLAELMVLGRWNVDMVPCLSRDRLSTRLVSGQPREITLRGAFPDVAADVAPGLACGQVHPGGPAPVHQSQSLMSKTAFVKVYHPRHIILALAATRNSKDLSKLKEDLSAMMRFAFPADHRRDVLVQELHTAGFSVPSRNTLLQGRVRLDVAAMLYSRVKNNRGGRTVFRMLNYDGSPKGGIEIFGMREDSFEKGQHENIKSKLLPLAGLGHGHQGAYDKAACIVHAILLEVGHSPVALQVRGRGTGRLASVRHPR